MTTICLGIDGLEYDFVKKFRFRALEQKAYTKLNLEDFDVLITPPIWASMLTGEIPDELVEEFKLRWISLRRDSKLLDVARSILPNPTKKVLDFLWTKTVGSKGDRINVASYLKDKGIETVLDGKDSWTNGIMGYNAESFSAGELMREAFERREKSKEFEERKIKKLSADVNEFLKALDSNYDLYFFYTRFLDHLGHLFFGEKLKTLNHYKKINLLVKVVSDKLSKDDKLYVMSDHGMRPYGKLRGWHSDHGYFSSNTGELIHKPQELAKLLSGS